MTIPRIGLTAFVMLWLASAAGAQTTVDVSRLPIDVERIQRELQQSTIREEHDGLNLRYVHGGLRTRHRRSCSSDLMTTLSTARCPTAHPPTER